MTLMCAEPLDSLPNSVAILGLDPRTGKISALGPLSRRDADDGVLWGTTNQNTRQNKLIKIIVLTFRRRNYFFLILAHPVYKM